MPKYPDIHVQLTGQDGNAYMIMGLVAKAMREAGLTKAQIDEYTNESMSGDYNHLVATAAAYVEVH